jgi:hypothetical protein
MINKTDYVDLGLACADVCRALDRVMNGKKEDDLSQSMSEAMSRLTTWVKPAIHSLDISLTILLIAEPWRRFKRGSPNRVNGTHSSDLSMRKMIKRGSPVGSGSSAIFSSSSLCVRPFVFGRH